MINKCRKSDKKREADEKKKQDAIFRKAETKALLEKEMDEISKKAAKAASTSKVTRAQIYSKVETEIKVKEKEGKKKETHKDASLVENINKLQIEGEEARTVDEAVSVLSSKPKDIDKHPEKRMKAAYNAFEEKRLKELKLENPSLRLSQLKQMIFKEWQKSPENPFNQY